MYGRDFMSEWYLQARSIIGSGKSQNTAVWLKEFNFQNAADRIGSRYMLVEN